MNTCTSGPEKQNLNPNNHEDEKHQINKILNSIQKFSVVHQNAQSATNKVDELSLMADELQPDVFIISEHGFKPETVGLFRIENYELANSFERSHFKGGGVAVFVKSELTFHPLKVNHTCDLDFEVCGIKIILNSGGNIKLIGLYRSPNGCSDTFFKHFEILLNSINCKSSKFLIIGDFNIDVLNHTDPLTQRFRDILNSFGLIWSVDSPTRVTTTSSTAIDNVITNIPDASVTVLNAAISDHFALETVINRFSPEIQIPLPKIKRDMRAENIALLNTFLNDESWLFLNYYDGADESFTAFHDRFIFYLNATCPFKEFKERKKTTRNSWMTREILNLRNQLKFYYSIYVHSKCEQFRAFYRNFKNNYRKAIKSAKAREIEVKLKNCENFSKTAWNIIKEVTQQPKSLNKTQISKLKIQNEIITDPFKVADEFNAYFSSAALPEPCFKDSKSSVESFMGPVSSMALYPVSEQEVTRVIQGLKDKKSCDIDGISVWLLKRCFKQLLTPLTKLINMSFEQGIFPSVLKTAKVTPIFKKDDPCLASNYRPISILPVMSKVFEKVFLTRFEQFLDRFHIISSEQFGFRKNKSTIDAVTTLIESVVDGLERKEHVLSIFLDLSKAFDCVHHETLLYQLTTCGVRGLPHEWLSSYLWDRNQCVQIANSLSGKVEMAYGVPQGSILGPVLFLLYVNKLNSSILKGNVVQYADDTTLCIRAKTKHELEINSFLELNSCIQYFSTLNLKANSSKSTVINFCLHSQEIKNYIAVMADDDLLEETDSTKFLGMHLDRGLTWNDHIESVCSKVSSGIYVLRNLVKFCSLDILKTAYFGLVYPHLKYGLRLWGSCSKYKFERVFRSQKRAVRIISKMNFRESCKHTFRELGLLTLPCLYILEVVLYCKFSCDLIQGRDVHQYGTKGRDNFRNHQHRTSAFECLPSEVGVKLINRLPKEIKQINDPKKFKARLRNLLVSKVFYSVDEFMSRWDEIQN